MKTINAPTAAGASQQMLTVSNNVIDTSFTTKDEIFFDNGISDAE